MLLKKLCLEEMRLVLFFYARPVLGARSSLRRAVAPLAVGSTGQVERRASEQENLRATPPREGGGGGSPPRQILIEAIGTASGTAAPRACVRGARAVAGIGSALLGACYISWRLFVIFNGGNEASSKRLFELSQTRSGLASPLPLPASRGQGLIARLFAATISGNWAHVELSKP
jgi:hypothetical protein